MCFWHTLDIITVKHVLLATPRARNAAEPRSTRTAHRPRAARTGAPAQPLATTLGFLGPDDTLVARRRPLELRASPPELLPRVPRRVRCRQYGQPPGRQRSHTWTRGRRNNSVSGAHAAARGAADASGSDCTGSSRRRTLTCIRAAHRRSPRRSAPVQQQNEQSSAARAPRSSSLRAAGGVGRLAAEITTENTSIPEGRARPARPPAGRLSRSALTLSNKNDLVSRSFPTDGR